MTHKYEEFKNLKYIQDKDHPYVICFELDDGSRFYMEPGFYAEMQSFKTRRRSEYPLIVNKLIELVKENKKVIFAIDFENPIIELEDYIILEILDITDPLQIFVEDKSRGSDYGD